MLDGLEVISQPVALVAWALLVLVWGSWRAPGAVVQRRVVTALAAFYFAIATPLGANVVVGALERVATPAARGCGEAPPAGVIVVLAGGMSGEPRSADDFGRLHLTSLRRVIEGVRLARAAPDALLVLSGGTGGAVREADLMASLATELGVPRARLLVERESKTTAEGAANVARLLAARPGEATPVHLVTSAMHMPRAAASFRRERVEICPVPVDRRFIRPTAGEALIPQMTALDKSTAAWHELIGYVVYRAAGRL
jgi:uncharacterized SAM-binding protein YcdF (DUF218 family)